MRSMASRETRGRGGKRRDDDQFCLGEEKKSSELSSSEERRDERAKTHKDLLTSLLSSLRDERRVPVQALVHDDSKTPPVAGETVAESSDD